MPGRLDRILVVISGSLAAACGGMARPEPPSARESECVLTPAPQTTTVDGSRARAAPGRAPIVVAIDRPIDTERAPGPANAAEQVVFAQVYETLVRVDCSGSVIPGLAESWRHTAGDRGWVFTLRSGARFHDGTPVTARAVADGLVAAAARPVRREVAGRAAAPADIASVTVLSDDVVRVDVADSMRDPDPRGPAFFASPELAVHRARASGWPAGSGPYEAADTVFATGGDEAEVYLRPVRGAQAGQQSAGQADAPLPLAFRVTPGGDPRNALDVGVDVLVTADPDAIDYALARGSYVTAPLPWDAAYALFTPVGADIMDARTRVPIAALDDLARDAVPGVARASSLGASWTCGASSAPAASARRRPRIAFVRGDRAAAGLAERLVALARTDSAGWIRDVLPAAARASTLAAVPLSADELAASLRRGNDAAYVIAIDLNGVAPCPQPSGRASLRAVPLVDTRSTAILRGGLEGVTVDGDGTLRFAGAWRRAERETRR